MGKELNSQKFINNQNSVTFGRLRSFPVKIQSDDQILDAIRAGGVQFTILLPCRMGADAAVAGPNLQS